MSLTQGDVLNTLSDSVTLKMDFWVASVHVNSKWYGIIKEHVRAENIIVAEGNDSLASYDDMTDVLTTQAGTSPASLDQRALLLHECTHALVDIFYPSDTVTRHVDELSAYLAQMVYQMRSDPTFEAGTNPSPQWETFFKDVVELARKFKLDKPAGSGSRISTADLEPLHVQLAALPGVPYGDFAKGDSTGSNGLILPNPFVKAAPSASTTTETHPDPSDDWLIRAFQEQYAATDVRGYGGRLRKLRKCFALCSLGRAQALVPRLSVRKRGDKVSELFYDRLSDGGQAILLRVLGNRS